MLLHIYILKIIIYNFSLCQTGFDSFITIPWTNNKRILSEHSLECYKSLLSLHTIF